MSAVFIQAARGISRDFRSNKIRVDPVRSIHILGSREFGGADQFYVRLVRALYQIGQPVTAINRPGSPVARALDADPIEQIHVPLANRWDAWSGWQIRRRIRERTPCVVQTYMGRATRLTRVPQNSPAVHVARLGGFYKIDGYYRHADAWVGNTRAICDFLVKSGMPANRVHHIGNFVPEPLPQDESGKTILLRKYEVEEDSWVIFALGRLIPKKGFQDLLRAMALLPGEISGRPVTLMLAGNGPEMERLRTQAEELGITSRVRFLGWQDPPDAFYGLADVFVCPSRHEPLGNVILESWNHTVPVVSTRSDGALELIEDGVTGLLCDCKDAAGMAAAIRQTLGATESDRGAMASAGNARLHQHYGQPIIVEAYLTLYRELLAEKSGDG
jgi:L-malate glycosyltransferase